MYMKLLLFLFYSSLICPIFTFGHSGRTDSKGGHNDLQNGGYHYHKTAPTPLRDIYSGHIGCWKKQCPGILILKNGKYGKFYGCNKYPKCDGTTNYPFRCYRCKSSMNLRKNRLGQKFWGCSKFPHCRHTNNYR